MKNLDLLAAVAATAIGGYWIISQTGTAQLDAANVPLDTPTVQQASGEQPRAQETSQQTTVAQYQADCVGDIKQERASHPKMRFKASHTPEKACSCVMDMMVDKGVKESELRVLWGANKDFGKMMRMIDRSAEGPSLADTQRKVQALGRNRFVEIANISFGHAACMKPTNWDELYEEHRQAMRK